MSDALVSVRHLAKHFSAGAFRRGAVVRALDDISFDIARGEVVGLVGESGSGKTTIGRSILRLIEPTAGEVRFNCIDVTRMGPRALRHQRRRMQYIFQDPFASLSPRMTIAQILTEGLAIQHIGRRRERLDRAAAALESVELPADTLGRYAHEFSGGQRQRIGIARALVLEPDFLVADEPVSALDVSVQAQIVNLLRDLQARMGLTMLFISHDLAVVEFMCDRVIVLYLGRIMEIAPSEQIYANPRHPYTRALLSAIPSPDPDAPRNREILSGDIPSPANPPSGCVFRARCPFAFAKCAEAVPPLKEAAAGHFKACWLDALPQPPNSRSGSARSALREKATCEACLTWSRSCSALLCSQVSSRRRQPQRPSSPACNGINFPRCPTSSVMRGHMRACRVACCCLRAAPISPGATTSRAPRKSGTTKSGPSTARMGNGAS